jgi:outer membrane protein TolC
MRSKTFEGEKKVRQISGLLRGGLALLACLIVSAVASAQDAPTDPSRFVLQPAKASGVPVIKPITRVPNLVNPPGTTAVNTARLITLAEAQQQAAGAENPLARLGALQVEAAKQNRLAFHAQYFPNISATFANLHFNKFMGEQIQLRRPILGTTIPVALPLTGKDQTLAAFNLIQPLTPLLKVQQAVKIARADENIARAKAGMPVSETARKVEKNYFDLLIAQRELIVARVKAKTIQDKYLIASNSSAPRLSAEQEAELIGAEKTLVLANSKVQELSVSLNGLIGLPEETELELVAPPPVVEEVSLAEATQKAMMTNPEVVEAEQTAIKARAGRRLAKLDYVPDVVVLGGYVYQQNVVPLLPQDFTYIGVMATFTIFDGGKREHTVKMRNAQVEAAELAVVLTKAKVAASVKTSYFEMNRSRTLSELSHRMISTSLVVNAAYRPNSSEVIETRARLETEMFQAELAYREAFARLKTLMGDR